MKLTALKNFLWNFRMSTSYKYFISNDHPFKAKRGVVGRGVITPFFIKTSPYNCLPLTFSNFVHPPAPLPVASNPQPHCCLVSWAECMTVPHKLICHYTSSLCLLFFLSNFYFFIKWWPLKNYKKCFLFHLKSSFHSWDTQIFVIFSLPFQAFRFKTANRSVIIYDVTNWIA